MVNNAGTGFAIGFTKDNYPLNFQVNYLGHFLLNYLLLELIIKTKNARIVSASDLFYLNVQSLDFKPKDENGIKYPELDTYYTSKLLLILHMSYLAKRLKKFGVNTYSAHPGIVNTDVLNKNDNRFNIVVRVFCRFLMRFVFHIDKVIIFLNTLFCLSDVQELTLILAPRHKFTVLLTNRWAMKLVCFITIARWKN